MIYALSSSPAPSASWRAWGRSARFTARGLALTGLVASLLDDWDRYESLHWRALEEYLAENNDGEIRERHERSREEYLQYQRRLLGWGIFVGRKAG